MPFDGSGNFSRIYRWQEDRDNGINILAQRMDAEFDNFAAGMNQVLFRNGIVPLTGNLNVAQNAITGLGAGGVTLPSIRWADDSGSGLFLNGVGRPSVTVAGTTRLEVNNAGANVTGILSATTLREGANQVWHAGNLNPANFIGVNDAQFTGITKFGGDSAFNLMRDTASDPVLNFSSGAYITHKRGANELRIGVGTTDRIYVYPTYVGIPSLSATGASFGAANIAGAGSVVYQGTAGLSGRLSRGIASPSGGSDGDIYFQYTA